MGDLLRRVGREFTFGNLNQGAPIVIESGIDPSAPPIVITPDGRISGLPSGGGAGAGAAGGVAYQPQRQTFLSAFLSNLPNALIRGVQASRGPGGGFVTGLAGSLAGAQEHRDYLGQVGAQKQQTSFENEIRRRQEERAQAQFEEDAQDRAARREADKLRTERERFDISFDSKTGRVTVIDKDDFHQRLRKQEDPNPAVRQYGGSGEKIGVTADTMLADVIGTAKPNPADIMSPDAVGAGNVSPQERAGSAFPGRLLSPEERAAYELAKRQAEREGSLSPVAEWLKEYRQREDKRKNKGGAGGAGPLLAVPQPGGSVKLQRIREGEVIPKGSRTVGDFSQPEKRKITGANQAALRYLLRGVDASDNIAEVEEKIAEKGLGGQVWLEKAPNWAQSEEGQLYNQASAAFTEARLRKDSGAAIPAHEYAKDRKIYFAQPGDNKKTLRSKQRGRAVVLEGLAAEAGGAYEDYFGEEFRPGQFKEKYGKENGTIKVEFDAQGNLVKAK